MIDKPAPAFDLAPLDGGGEPVARAALKGQVVLVNFFASWCVPCRIEHPMLMRLAKQEQVPLYGIAYKDQPAAARSCWPSWAIRTARSALDADGRTGIDFGVYGVPETYVIDKTGRDPQAVRRSAHGQRRCSTELLPLLQQLNAS